MVEAGVFLFRCVRCCAAFILRERTEKYGPSSQWEALEANPCAACGKGAVEYVGIVWLTPDKKRAT